VRERGAEFGNLSTNKNVCFFATAKRCCSPGERAALENVPPTVTLNGTSGNVEKSVDSVILFRQTYF
jgi:hypothetical protein